MAYPKITQQNMIRRDKSAIQDVTHQYEASIEKLRYGTKKIMADIHTILQNQINFYIHSIDLRDQNQRMGAEIIGYSFPYERPSVKVGEHFIARKHPKIPQGKIDFKAFFEYRDTYSIDSHEWKYCLEGVDKDPSMALDNLRSQQLAAFGRTIQNFLAFVSYLIFHNPARGKNNQPEKLDKSEAEDAEAKKTSRRKDEPQNTGSEYRKTYYEWAEPEFEAYLEFIFNPEDASTKGYPVGQQVLALEKLNLNNDPATVKNIATVNKLLDKIKEIRKALRETKKVEYDDHSAKFQNILSLNTEVCESLSLREKILWTAKDMVYNAGEYMVDINQYGKFNPTVKASDLIAIISYKDVLNLKLGIPEQMEPSNWQFTTDELGVGQIIETKWMPRGQAVILHKDLIKLWITDTPVGEAEYEEHSVVNTWMDLMFYLDMVTWYGCAYITRKQTPG